jgi:nucleotide-binding universal stress UspA family protein
MALKNLLVHLDSTARAGERLRLAIALARRHGARLTGVFAEGTTLGGTLLGRRTPQAMERAADDARAAFEAATRDAGLVAGWKRVEPGESADVVGWLALCCRYFDLCVVGQHDPDHDESLPADLVEQLLAQSGRPVLVVPYAGHFPEAGRTVLVAWTGSREAARAVNDALPLLQTAERVVVLSAQRTSSREGPPLPSPSLDVLEHLRAHGVEATRETTFVEDVAPGDLVLNRAADAGADLVVMGAHGTSGFPLFRRSSAARDALETMTAPFLLSR